MTGCSTVTGADAKSSSQESQRSLVKGTYAVSPTTSTKAECGDSHNYCMPNTTHYTDSLDSGLESGPPTAAISISGTKKKKRRFKPAFSDSSSTINTFYDLYSLNDDVLGEGALSSVHTCIEIASGQEYAVKIVQCTSREHRRRLLREIEILHLCQHQEHIVRLKTYFEARDKFFVVFYKANGGPLLEHIRRRGCFSEGEVRAVMFEIVEALVFLHHKGIAHRDLKPANILCERYDQVSPIRICDFDLGSNLYSTKSPSYTPQLGTPVGSCEFMAPEVLAAFANQDLTYDKKCDMWSLGVILYIMLSGRPPFRGGCGGNSCTWDEGGDCADCQDILISAISCGDFQFPHEDWHHVSESAKDLIRALLTQCPRQRPSAEEVLAHSWMTCEAPTTPLNTVRNLKEHGTQTAAISFRLKAYSLSNSIVQHYSSNSPVPLDFLGYEHYGEEELADVPKRPGLRYAQSSPPSLYAQRVQDAVRSAFPSEDFEYLADGMDDLDLQ